MFNTKAKKAALAAQREQEEYQRYQDWLRVHTPKTPKFSMDPENRPYSIPRQQRAQASVDTYNQAYNNGTLADFYQNNTGAGSLVPVQNLGSNNFYNKATGPSSAFETATPGNAMVPVSDVYTRAEGLGAVPKSNKASKLGGFFDDVKGGAADILGSAMDAGKQGWANIKAGRGIMPKYAGLAKGAMGAMAGLKAVQGISEYQNAQNDTEDLVNDILASAAGNDNYRYDLSTDQLKTLRQLQNGTFDTSGDFDMGSVLGNLGNIATGAGLGFVTGGGIPGALLGAAGGVVDGVSSGMIGNQNQITADLEGLYQALYESEMRNKAMKRDAAMQRYANSIY